uniref:Uncharacterized protein n=1 Tax=Daphnia magna TaxID=35525 RepID=A0A0N8DV03_9CRUS
MARASFCNLIKIHFWRMFHVDYRNDVISRDVFYRRTERIAVIFVFLRNSGSLRCLARFRFTFGEFRVLREIFSKIIGDFEIVEEIALLCEAAVGVDAASFHFCFAATLNLLLIEKAFKRLQEIRRRGDCALEQDRQNQKMPKTKHIVGWCVSTDWAKQPTDRCLLYLNRIGHIGETKEENKTLVADGFTTNLLLLGI